MYAPINQIQSPDDEDEDRHDVVEDCKNIDSSIKESVQEYSFPSYYNHNFGQARDFTIKSHNFGAVSSASNPMKISYERLIQEGYDLALPKVKAKKRKAEVVDDGGGGRVVRATGRKDRHSKVRTARGPRDRRVRLSPRTAIQFYDVQDRLGYDRPSKAIDWLINEAKTAIDALEEQPILKFSDSDAAEIPNHGGFSLSQRGMREKQEHLDDDDGGSHVSGFGCFVNEAAPSSAAGFEAYLGQDFSSSRNRSEIYPNFCSALNSTPPILETNWEIARLQKMFTWNCGDENSGNIRGGGGGGAEYSSGNSLPPHAVAQPVSGHINLFSQREPLQSSIINYNSPINSDFAGFNFSNELSKIAASATPRHDENLKKLIFSLPSTTTSHYQG